MSDNYPKGGVLVAISYFRDCVGTLGCITYADMQIRSPGGSFYTF
jgi:hypothetical protein